MLNLYFGNVPSALSTILFLVFVVFVIITMKRPDSRRKWKIAAIITVLMGIGMSALSGIKDSMGDMMAVSFEQMNAPLAVLCTLGGLALLIGIVAAFCRKEKINKILFYSLSLIIVAKTIIVEVLRIASFFNSL